MKRKSIPWYYIIVTTVIAFLLGTLFHYLYQWTGRNMIAGLFFPINESMWEHLKLIFYPMLLIWSFSMHNNSMHSNSMDTNRSWPNRYFACLLSIAAGFTLTTGGYYLFRCGFGIEAAFINIAIYIIGLFCGQFIATHLTFNTRISKWIGVLSIMLLAIKVLEFAIFSIQPLNLPIFIAP